MSTPLLEIKKTRKPRTTMKSVVLEVVRQNSIPIVETETVFENDKQEEKRLKTEIEIVEDSLEQNRKLPMTDKELDTLINGYTCVICDKTFKRNTPALIERHNASAHHQQLAYRKTFQEQKIGAV